LKDFAPFTKLVDLSNVSIGERCLCNPSPYFRGKEIDVVRENERPFERISVGASDVNINQNPLECAIGAAPYAPVKTNHLYTIAWLAFVDEIIVKNDICAPWQLPWRGALRHFLNADPLMIPKYAMPVLHLQRVAVIVLLWRDRRGWWKIGCRSCRITVLARMKEFRVRAIVD
jgi:hypothetical protein